MYVHIYEFMCTTCVGTQGPEDSMGIPESGAPCSCKPPHECWESQEPYVLLPLSHFPASCSYF